MTVRNGEQEKNWYRSERIMYVNGLWYFITRELSQEGPFSSKHEAEMELNLYIRHANDYLLRKSG